MTQEEKAKAYDEVRKKIAIRFGSNVADEIFSQFEESEDEKIRKQLIRFFESCGNLEWYDGLTPQKAVTWLEKQGEQKTKENEELRLDCIKNLEQQDPLPTSIYAEWLKSLRPQKQWKPTEEQLRELHCVISGCSYETPVLVELEKQLKNLL